MSFPSFVALPQLPHFQAAMHLLCYLRSITFLGLQYRKGEDATLIGYTNANWPGDTEDKKSTDSYIFLVGGTPMTWNSSKQPIATLSSIEAEYRTMTEGTKEVVWLRCLFVELKILDTTQPTILRVNN